MLHQSVKYLFTFCSLYFANHWEPIRFPRVSPACSVHPISTAVPTTETYYFSKCCKIDLSRHIVTQNPSLLNHRLPVHCLSAFRQLKEHKKIWSAPGSRAAAVKLWAILSQRWELVFVPKLCESSAISSSGHNTVLSSTGILNRANHVYHICVFWNEFTF